MLQTVEMRRETLRVSFLMCPFCVRALMPGEATRLSTRFMRRAGRQRAETLEAARAQREPLEGSLCV